MSSINFITTLTAKQHRTLRTWWRFSLILFFGITINIVILEGMQLYALYTTVSDHKNLQEQTRIMHSKLEPYTSLKKEEEALRAQRIKIDHIYHTAERSRILLASLHTTDQSAHVQSCKLNKTDFELIVQCPDTESVLNEIKRLRTLKQFREVKLVSLSQAKKDASMIATIQGKIDKA